MSLIPPFYKDAVVAIGRRELGNPKVKWIATGFLVLREVKSGEGIPFLVSNKHVFQAAPQSIVIRMKEDGQDTYKDLDIPIVGNDGKPVYYGHSNDNVDVAVLRLDANMIRDNRLAFPHFDIDKHAMTSSEMRQHGVDEGALVYMLGFTMGLVNHDSGLPICRLGCIARCSEAQIKEDNRILIDIQNFPGNSGSPIIYRPDALAIKGTQRLSRAVLVGVVCSYIAYKDNLISAKTNQIVEVRMENSGLALAHPVEFIRDIIDVIMPL